MRKYLQKTFILFPLLWNSAFSQVPSLVQGYLIRSTGDTLEGEVKVNPKKNFENFTKVIFKDDQNGQKTYKPGDIKGYGFKGNNFITSKFAEELWFYKVLCNGKIMLYEIIYKGVGPNADYISDYHIVKQGHAEFTKIKQRKIKKQLGEFMKDKPDVLNGFEDSKFEIEKVIAIINKFNNG